MHQQSETDRPRAPQLSFREQRLPPGPVLYGSGAGNLPNCGVWDGFSAQALLLGYIEQTPLYNTLNFNQSSTQPANSTGVTTKINAFLCPSDPNAGGSFSAGAFYEPDNDLSNIE